MAAAVRHRRGGLGHRDRHARRPDQRALPIAEFAESEAIYAYSFICTNLDVATPEAAVAVKHWYRHQPPQVDSSPRS